MRTTTAKPESSLFSAFPVASKRRDAGPTLELTGPETFIGDPVYSKAGEHLGSIREIILDLATGKISHAVLTQGEAFHRGGNLVAAPWQALTQVPGNRFELAVDKQRFDRAPSFDYDSWPDLSHPVWALDAWYGDIAQAA
jgi:sporulation protein YlmC with PRC-barrel domain